MTRTAAAGELEAFEPEWYARMYPDVSRLDMSPWEHWTRHGRNEGRAPCRPNVEIPPKLDNPGRPRVLADVGSPRYTIIVPCHNQWHLTQRCLVAIADRTDADATPYEVILADDASDDETAQCESRLPGVRRIVNDSGLRGFVGNVNHAAENAQGEFLVLLNNDTEVQQGWLEAVDDTFRVGSRVGIVGAKLLFPDGVLQEAGCSLFRDGGTRNEGRGHDPHAARFEMERACDYVSGACLAIRTELWRELDGFDETFAPAYYEDVDLALRTWKRGYSVVYQPRCNVVHVDGGTMSSQRESKIAASRDRFARKWERDLKEVPTQDTEERTPNWLAPTFSASLRRTWRALPIPADAKRGIEWQIYKRLLGGRLRVVETDRKSVPHGPGRVTVAGFLQSGLGLGEAARLDVLALQTLGYAPARLDVSPAFGLCDLPDVTFANTLPTDSGPILIHVNAPELPVTLDYIGPDVVRRRYVIGYWAWELPRAPRHWRQAYRYIDELWVVSEHCARAFRQDDCPVPVYAVPHPVRVPQSDGRNRSDFGLPEDKVVFLAMSDMRSSFDRKNLLGAVEAFRDACGDDSGAVLILKVHHVEAAPRNADRLWSAIGKLRNVRVMDDFLTRGEMGDLLRCCDVFLSPHRAEGFGLVLAECLLLGTPVIATNYSGNVDFMDEGSAALVDYELVPVRDVAGVYGGRGQKWADPNADQLTDWIAKLARDESCRRELGQAGRRYAERKFSPEAYIDKLSPGFRERALRYRDD